ncbi:hypothetical protein HanPSC8_Chr03g0120451 [Helianthus annuus]|nr:hypothetical protein HanPSC8_Chr03g0120451 [Helianthus annuus]
MLTCITCSKQQIEDGGEEVGARGTPSSKETVKSLTAQVSFPTLILSNLHYTLMSSSYVANVDSLPFSASCKHYLLYLFTTSLNKTKSCSDHAYDTYCSLVLLFIHACRRHLYLLGSFNVYYNPACFSHTIVKSMFCSLDYR